MIFSNLLFCLILILRLIRLALEILKLILVREKEGLDQHWVLVKLLVGLVWVFKLVEDFKLFCLLVLVVVLLLLELVLGLVLGLFELAIELGLALAVFELCFVVAAVVVLGASVVPYLELVVVVVAVLVPVPVVVVFVVVVAA